VTSIKVKLLEDQYTFMIISRSFLHKMINVSDKIFRENQNTFLYSIIFSEGRSNYEIVWQNMVELGSSKMAI